MWERSAAYARGAHCWPEPSFFCEREGSLLLAFFLYDEDVFEFDTPPFADLDFGFERPGPPAEPPDPLPEGLESLTRCIRMTDWSAEDMNSAGTNERCSASFSSR
jgi:hypothetical protein